MEYIEQLEQGRYGSFELKKLVGRNLLRGLVISILVHAAVVVSPYVAALFEKEEEIPKHVIVIDPSVLRHLKPQQNTQKQVEISRPKIAPPKASVPIAVPEEQVQEQQQMMPSQAELSQMLAANTGEDTLNLAGADVVFKETDEVIPDPGIFQPFEVAPEPLPDFQPRPQTPEMAKAAAVPGKVVVQVYVDKKGEVKKWKIVQEKPAGLGFGDEVLKVIPKWKFTPAIQQGNPIGVWIAIPFNFQYKK